MDVLVLENIQAVAEHARKKTEEKTLRAVIAAGGDGTVRLVAEHTTAEMPLAVLPLGTENLVSKYLELPTEPAGVADLVLSGWNVQLDAGEANGKLFTLMTGCGFDAEVVRRLHNERKGNIHHLSYAKPILDSIRNYDYPLLRVDCQAGEERLALSGCWVFVVNLPRYAGGLNFAPAAAGNDGLLDICTFKEGSLWHGLVYLGGVMLGQHEGMDDFVRVQTRRLRVEADGAAPYQLDGDPGGDLPVEFSVMPGRLTMLVDCGWAKDHGFVAADEVPTTM